MISVKIGVLLDSVPGLQNLYELQLKAKYKYILNSICIVADKEIKKIKDIYDKKIIDYGATVISENEINFKSDEDFKNFENEISELKEEILNFDFNKIPFSEIEDYKFGKELSPLMLWLIEEPKG